MFDTVLGPPSTTIRAGCNRASSVAITAGIASGRTNSIGPPSRPATAAPDNASG